jgi:hypothetical protein
MPIQVSIYDKKQWLFPKADWQTMKLKSEDLEIDPDFYVLRKKL